MNPGKKNQFDEQLREKFEGFRPDAPAGLWEKIAAELDEQHPRRRRVPTWWMAVAATIVVVSGIVYWQNRPVSVTYLHARAEEPVFPAQKSTEPVASAAPVDTAELPAEPLDLEKLRHVFAKRERNISDKKRLRVQEPVEQSAEVLGSAASPQLASHETEVAPADRSLRPGDTLKKVNTAITAVPPIEPPVVLEEEETMLASSDPAKQPFGVSSILNYVVGTVDQRDEKLVTFSNDEEGSLKLDFNFSLARNKKKRIK